MHTSQGEQGGAALTADWRCFREQQPLTWLSATQMSAACFCFCSHWLDFSTIHAKDLEFFKPIGPWRCGATPSMSMNWMRCFTLGSGEPALCCSSSPSTPELPAACPRWTPWRDSTSPSPTMTCSHLCNIHKRTAHNGASCSCSSQGCYGVNESVLMDPRRGSDAPGNHCWSHYHTS